MNIIELQRSLRHLRLGSMALTLETRLVEAQSAPLPHLDFLSALSPIHLPEHEFTTRPKANAAVLIRVRLVIGHVARFAFYAAVVLFAWSVTHDIGSVPLGALTLADLFRNLLGVALAIAALISFFRFHGVEELYELWSALGVFVWLALWVFLLCSQVPAENRTNVAIILVYLVIGMLPLWVFLAADESKKHRASL